VVICAGGVVWCVWCGAWWCGVVVRGVCFRINLLGFRN